MSRSGRILVVDDEANARTALGDLLRDEGFEIALAADGLEAMRTYDAFEPHVVVTDLQMPGMDGIEVVKEVRTKEAPAEVIVITAFADVATAVEAMRVGAADYLTKPVSFDELLVVIDKVIETGRLRRETRELRARIRDLVHPTNIIGSAPVMQNVFEVIEQVAPSTATVLISGESGTGKELVANAIHQRSPRAAAPFVKLHCAALAESLLESELFGHEKGSFTGAMTRKDGRFSLADGGTLFLDEIGEISPTIQVKLLRFLQEREFERVGGTQTLKVDVRIIAATNRDLHAEVLRGKFREDLYYRLNVVTIQMPPLRERRTDIPALAQYFLTRYAKANDKSVEGFDAAALEFLASYDWPGNVRELENAIERAVVLCKGSMIEPKHLPPHLKPATLARLGAPMVPGASMDELERYAILETLKACGGSTSKAARILHISARTIQYRLHQYNDAPRSQMAVVQDEARLKS